MSKATLYSKTRDKVNELVAEELLTAEDILDMALEALGEEGIIDMLDDHGLCDADPVELI